MSTELAASVLATTASCVLDCGIMGKKNKEDILTETRSQRELVTDIRSRQSISFRPNKDR